MERPAQKPGRKTAAAALLMLMALTLLRLAAGNPRYQEWLPEMAGLLGLVHATIYLCLLILFMRTLLPGREPLITRAARRARGPLPPELLIYTRHVTMLWAVVFGVQLIASAVVLAIKPLAVWVHFLSICNLPVVLAVALGEYAYRHVRFRRLEPTSFIDSIRAYRQVKSGEELP